MAAICWEAAVSEPARVVTVADHRASAARVSLYASMDATSLADLVDGGGDVAELVAGRSVDRRRDRPDRGEVALRQAAEPVAQPATQCRAAAEPVEDVARRRA